MAGKLTFRGARSLATQLLAMIALASALVLAAATAQAQPPFGLSPEAYAVFNRWMLASCIGGDERELADALRRYPQPLTKAFQQAIRKGPSPEELREVRAGAEVRFESRAKFPLSEFRISGVSEEDLARFNRVSRQEYVDDQVRRFQAGYRSNAVAGLGAIGGPAARAVLSRIAADRRDPLAPAAREALKAKRPT
jgi:hypothetical protein